MNVQIFDGSATYNTAAAATTTSAVMKVINTDGYFSLQWSFANAGGTATLKVLSSNDGVNFVDCNTVIGGATVAPVAATVTAMAEVIMVPCKWCKITCLANGGAGITLLNVWFYGVERVSA